MSDQTDDLGMALAANRERFPRAVYAVECLVTFAPMFRNAVTNMVRNYGDTFFQRAQARIGEIDFLCGHDANCFDRAVQAYVRFCFEFVRKQKVFLRTGEYSIKNFNEIYDSLYNNKDSMQNFYLVALLFSFIFSPNYYEFYDFFEKQFLTSIPPAGTVAEIGCGHGLYLAQTLLANPGWYGLGVDISASALEITRKVFSYYGIGENRYKLSLEDVRGNLGHNDSVANAVICCEVMEHLPAPRHALSELLRIITDDGILMLSAAIRMESVDHLYVFHTCQEFSEMVREVGFHIKMEHMVPLTKGNVPNKVECQRLINDPRTPIGYICLAHPA